MINRCFSNEFAIVNESRAARRRGGRRSRNQPVATPAATPAAVSPPPSRSRQPATGGYHYYSSSDEWADDVNESTYDQQYVDWSAPPVDDYASQRHEQQRVDVESDSDDDDEVIYGNSYGDDDDDSDSDDYMFDDYVTHYANGEGMMYPAPRRASSTNQRSNNLSRRTPAAAQPKPPPPPPVLCRFYVLGKCRYGSHCSYSHEIPAPSAGYEMTEEDSLTAAAALVDCPYFLRGRCKYGQYCRLRHAGAPTPATAASDGCSGDASLSQQAQSSAAAASSAAADASANGSNQANPEQEYTCGICFDDVVDSGKHFGLLSCDHCYCLDCLRSWRQSKDMEAEVTRSCPACRLPSNYIVPSLTFCTGAQKQQVVDAYKSHLSVRECKYFNGLFGSCPFGQHCFYAHRNSEGTDIKHLDRPRRSAKHRSSRRGGGGGGGGDAGVSNESLSSLLSNYGSLFRFLESLDWDEYGDAFEMDSGWD